MERLRKAIFYLPAFLLLAALVSGLAHSRAVPVFAPPGSSVRLLVLMYHSLVTDDSAAAQYVCPISRVESDFSWLRNNGYESVSLSQLVAFADGRGTLPSRPVLITLDDGYRNNLTLLPALLEQYDMRAVISVVGEYADIYTASGEDGSPHTCMSWADLRRAAEEPRLELACHAYYFHHLENRKGAARKYGESASDWRAALTADTLAIRRALEEQCGVSSLCYAYPFGQISAGADDLLAELGFRVTLSCSEIHSRITAGDPACLYSLGRFNRDGRLSTEVFMKKVTASLQ